MSNIPALIDLIAQGKNAEASDLLNQELLTRSYAEINQLKPEIARQYFAPVVGEPEVENEPDEEDTETSSELEQLEDDNEEELSQGDSE